MTLLLYTLLTTALYYLGARALITRWLWTRYPAWFDQFMDCAACVGFWWGFILAATIGRVAKLDLLMLPSWGLLTPIAAGLCTLVLTPIMAGLMHKGLQALGVAAPAETPPLPPEDDPDEPTSIAWAPRADLPIEPY